MILEILLVENSATTVFLVKRALTRWKSPYNLHAVSTAEEALNFINREGDHRGAPRPHITLLDLNLPDEPGFTVLKAIKDNPDFRNIAVVVMSNSVAPSDIKKAVELHTNAFIPKPVDWEAVEKMFEALESFWRLDVRFRMRDPLWIP